jgi:hypothetical protein
LLAKASHRKLKVAQESQKSNKSRFKTIKKTPQSLKTGRGRGRGGGGVGVWEISESNNLNYFLKRDPKTVC